MVPSSPDRSNELPASAPLAAASGDRDTAGARDPSALQAQIDALQKERAALQAELARMQALLVAVPDLIIRLHRDGTYLDFVAAKDIPSLVPRSERIGRSVRQVLPLDIALAYEQATAAALASGRTQSFSYRLHIADQDRFYEARVAQSGADEVLLVVRDVTTDRVADEALRAEKERSDRLLRNILPPSIVDTLKHSPGRISQRFDSATVLFADIVGFTSAAASLPPSDVVHTLNEIFSTFDAIAETQGIEKIKTIGDAYMAVGGVPIPCAQHAEAVAKMALAMQAAVSQFAFPGHPPLSLRIGIASGPVVAGVIGVRKFIYDLWGDTVNIASRMESTGEPGRIQVAESTYQVLRQRFRFDCRGEVAIKGRGSLPTYFLLGPLDETLAATAAAPVITSTDRS
jgi:class 3 adenylate cyclase